MADTLMVGHIGVKFDDIDTTKTEIAANHIEKLHKVVSK